MILQYNIMRTTYWEGFWVGGQGRGTHCAVESPGRWGKPAGSGARPGFPGSCRNHPYTVASSCHLHYRGKTLDENYYSNITCIAFFIVQMRIVLVITKTLLLNFIVWWLFNKLWFLLQYWWVLAKWCHNNFLFNTKNLSQPHETC